MIPALEQIIKRGGQLGVEEIVIGMAAPRPAQRARQRAWASRYRAIFNEFQGGSLQARRRRGLGRREVPPRRLVRPRVRRQHRAPVADRQPVAPRDRRSRWCSARCAPSRTSSGDADERTHGAAAAAARRRRLRRPGRGGRVLRPVGPQGPPHRRHDPLHRQQPDRLHHRAALLALLALSAPTSR